MRRLSGVLLLSAALALAPTVASAAGKGGGGKGGGSTLAIPDGVYGGAVTAAVSNPPAGTWVESTCTQNGQPVIYNRVEADAAGSAVLQLGPTTGYTAGVGGADCTAIAKRWDLKRQRWVVFATTTHQVSD